MNWRYMLNGQTMGPVDLGALQALLDSGTLNGESLVQREGTVEWVAAKTIPELRVPQSNASGAGAGAPPLVGTGAPMSDAEDIEKNKIFAVVAYLGILFLVPLLAVPNSKFARYHANQGVVLLLATLVLAFGSMILSMIPFLGCVFWLVAVAVMVGAFILMIIGMMNAAAGQYKPLPIIGHYQLLK